MPNPEIALIQSQILALLQKTQETDISDLRIFLNKNTLRLTSTGYKIFKTHYQSWEFEQPPTKSGQLIELLKKMKFPYYTNSKRIVLFNEQDAFMCRLAGPDGWLKSK